MKYLTDLIKTTLENKELMAIEGIRDMMKDVEDFKVFYYIPKVEAGLGFMQAELKQLEMPFEKMFIEFKNPRVVEIPGSTWFITALFIQELAPDYQRIYYFVNYGGKHLFPGIFSIDKGRFGFGNSPHKEVYEMLGKHSYYVAHEVLDMIKQNRLVFAENNEGVNIRTRVNRQFIKVKYKPKDVIYIGSKPEVKKHLGTRKIINKPDYAYEVMGHWRITNSIGKDRQGNRVVKGYTWVRPYTKGQGEVMKKVRVVK